MAHVGPMLVLDVVEHPLDCARVWADPRRCSHPLVPRFAAARVVHIDFASAALSADVHDLRYVEVALIALYFDHVVHLHPAERGGRHFGGRAVFPGNFPGRPYEVAGKRWPVTGVPRHWGV